MARNRSLSWLFAIVGLVAGSLVGFAAAPHPLYRSDAAIYISSVGPSYGSSSGVIQIPGIVNLMAAQVALLQPQDVAMLAMESPEWQALGRGHAQSSLREFQESIEVTHRRGEPAFRVSFRDREAKAAQVGVNAVLDAYQVRAKEMRFTGQEEAIERARHELRRRMAEVRNLSEKFRQLTDPHGGERGMSLSRDRLLRMLQVAREDLDAGMPSSGGDAEKKEKLEQAWSPLRGEETSGPCAIRDLPGGHRVSDHA